VYVAITNGKLADHNETAIILIKRKK
jgi:hypothetical protein